MNFEISDILTLNDNNDYVIVSIINYLNEDYAFLIDINNKNNIIYSKINNDKITVLDKKNKELINTLNKLFEKTTHEFLKNELH